MVTAPSPYADGQLPNAASHQFFAQRGVYAQLAIFRDWIAASTGMSARIDYIINLAFMERLQYFTRMAALQKVLFLLAGILIGFVLSRIGVGR